ncbi:hypothetical protein [Streptosporangium minutum]|uniref:Uncharacterized protein n=1 Tax=Streptosporangium minutum TaxID=569862 RepID=A0A243RIX7_9ACTN|nr:hypothetical protein [Streptosporangium minutum]OUC94844.1 hypothetical protein CA984_20960 [Streptosporangium minutum]
MRAKTTGFTGIIPTREAPWRAMFLRGERVAQISETGLVWEGPLTDIHQRKLTLPEPYASCTEAALDLHVPYTSTRMVFIAGDRCLDWEWNVGQKYEGPVTGLPNFGPYLPAEYRSDIDAAMQVAGTPWKTLLIKGERCALIAWGRGVEYEGPLTARGEAGWKKLPAHMRGDFDDALMLYAGGNNRTVFIKGDQAMDFHWIDGPTKIGPWAQVLPGLGALPAAYRAPRLPAAGRFSGTTDDEGDNERVDLRIDLTGPVPVISGDTFSVSTGQYLNSFVLKGGQPVTLPATISGTAEFADSTQTPKISVVVDKLAPGGTATLTRSADDGTDATTFTCAYVSRFLRTIDWEVDAVAGTKPAPQYFTGTDPRPPGLTTKLITVQSAYAEAGIELRTAGTVNEIGIDKAGADLKWSDAELHAAMESNFSGHRNTEQWKLWSFVATRHVDGNRGIMFDYDWDDEGEGKDGPWEDDFQRQGMAVFSDELVEDDGPETRKTLRTWVHEIGHALNLQHSWEKDKPGPQGGHGDLSWMNYDYQYWRPGDTGSEDREVRVKAYWAAFAYQFTDDELRHLRHGFYRNIVPGGNAWAQGSADRSAPTEFTPPPTGRSGLRLELYGRDTFSHGEPVVTEIKLSLDGTTGQAAAFPNLSPRGEHLTILVTDPAGAVRPFRPIARGCGSHRPITLDAATPALYDSAYLGYGADGLTFTQPGTYRLRALCKAPDGSTVTSPEHTIQISPPQSQHDRQAGDLLIGAQQGTLLALLGSDAPQLARGNAALDQLITAHPDHPLALYAHMVKGTNAGRHFLTLGKNGIGVRPADTATSIEELGAVVQTTLDPGTDAGIDNITLNATMRRLARAHARAGDLKQADVVLDQLVDTFRDKHVPPPVLATIAEQAETTRTQLHDQA